MPRKSTTPPATVSPATVLHTNLPIIEVAEPWQLDALLADAGVSRFILARLSDHVAAVAPGQVEALQTRLRRLGHTPKIRAE
jgi:hypothetical protein